MSKQKPIGVSRVCVDVDRGPLKVDDAHEVYAESRLIEAAAALQKTVLILGSPHIRHWFDEGLLARARRVTCCRFRCRCWRSCSA